MKQSILFLSMAVFIIMAFSSCDTINNGEQPKTRPPGIEDIPVVIKTRNLPGNKPEVIPPVLALRYNRHQQVVWLIEEDVHFRIIFKDNGDNPKSPFVRDEFDSNDFQDTPVVSGEITENPGKHPQFYEYSVEVDGLEALDPIIIIWR